MGLTLLIGEFRDFGICKSQNPNQKIRNKKMYLQRRNRILRQSPAIRSLIAETVLSPNDFIVPLFIDEGQNIRSGIASMPGYYRLSLDLTVKEVRELWNMGLKSVLL